MLIAVYTYISNISCAIFVGNKLQFRPKHLIIKVISDMIFLSCLIINNMYIKGNFTIISILSHPKHPCTFKCMELCSKSSISRNRYFIYSDILFSIVFILGYRLVASTCRPVYLIIEPHFLFILFLIVKHYFHGIKPFFIEISTFISESTFRTGMRICGFNSYFCLKFQLSYKFLFFKRCIPKP